jgi:hypothetical protein
MLALSSSVAEPAVFRASSSRPSRVITAAIPAKTTCMTVIPMSRRSKITAAMM